jgi:two-component system sensor histidine kinase EvgS
LDEVLDNAFKFSRAGSQVIVEGTLAPEKKFYRLRINDHGRGMTAEQIRRVDGLTPFDRHLYAQQSLGLGLVLVQQICQLYQGHLNIKSVPGEGTQVEILLPVHPAT